MALTKLPSQPSGEDAAQYIAAIARELRSVAAKADLGFLAYLLSMVEDEAATSGQKQAEQREGA